MLSLLQLSPDIRTLLQFFAFMLFCANMGCTVYNALQKRKRQSISGLLGCTLDFAVWQLQSDITAHCLTGLPMNPLAYLCACRTSLLYVAALLISAAIFIWLLADSLAFSKDNITSSAIKLCADYMPCGICYWRNGGRVIFNNICMNDLCREITDSPLLNGDDFLSALPPGLYHGKNGVWSFIHRRVEYKSEMLHELIAMNVSEIYSKNEALKEGNEKLAVMNAGLRKYNLAIDEMVRGREILQAKQTIHDEMNRLLLSAMAIPSSDTEKMNNNFRLWQQNALMLCRDASSGSPLAAVADVDKLADALDVKIIWKTELPSDLDSDAVSLFNKASREAIANAVKHAKASAVTIDFKRSLGGISFSFANDGTMPSGYICFSGGLDNLNHMVMDLGGGLSADIRDGQFILTITLPYGRLHS